MATAEATWALFWVTGVAATVTFAAVATALFVPYLDHCFAAKSKKPIEIGGELRLKRKFSMHVL